jgi:CRP-like cAMP-binding protein
MGANLVRALLGMAQVDVQQGAKANSLLGSLSASDFDLVRPHLSAIDLPLRRRLEGRNQQIDHAYFLTRGLASIVINAGFDNTIEIALVGREGMTGLSLLLQSDVAMHDTFIQSAGYGWSIGADELRAAMAKSATLHQTLLRFGHTLVTQMTFTALSNGRYRLEERLARWLLMAHDRADTDTVVLTHEFLALMMGVRRPGVTNALSTLQKRGIIEVRRGAISVKSRSRLEVAANGSYGAPEADYRRLILDMR